MFDPYNLSNNLPGTTNDLDHNEPTEPIPTPQPTVEPTADSSTTTVVVTPTTVVVTPT